MDNKDRITRQVKRTARLLNDSFSPRSQARPGAVCRSSEYHSNHRVNGDGEATICREKQQSKTVYAILTFVKDLKTEK